MPLPELWGECKLPCKNCPYNTDDTPKADCDHKWRHEVAKHLELSADGTVPFDMPEVCHSLGATVSKHLLDDGSRPSIQLFSEEPPQRPGFQVFRITEN
jgi:hypothetical protein